MNIKAEWIDAFERLLFKHDQTINVNNPDLSFQLAFAYFEWGNDGLPEYSVEEAFNRYLLNSKE